MSMRVVIPEILDHLPPDDPEAIRSRRDLRMINTLMGNDRWILKTLRNFPAAAANGITELGAGDGTLTAKIAAAFPDSTVTALDLAPRPANLPASIRWRQGDLFRSATPIQGGVLIANLFLHHFEGAALQQLGKLCKGFEILLFSEPQRAKIPHLLGALVNPLVNRVTRHDMHVSIDAGFVEDELPALMSLSPSDWQIQEHSTWRGAARMVGWRV
jgi:hypothetical protein